MPRSRPATCSTSVATPTAATTTPMTRDAVRAQRAVSPANSRPAAAASSVAPVFGWISMPLPSERSQGMPSG